MRLLEIVLLAVEALALVALAAPLPAPMRWLRLIAPLAPLVAGVQVAVERPRWQMVPAYVLSVLLLAAWLVQRTVVRGGPAGPGWIAWVAISLGALGLALSIALAVVFPVFRLPHPTGPHGIGTVTYHWVDAERSDVFSDDPAARREVMVQIWYPAVNDPSAPRVPYVRNAAILGPLARLVHAPTFVLRHLALVATDAVADAPVSADARPYPLLLFSHGRGGFRAHNTAQVQDLASHGYIVATIDHPGAAAGVEFPDGRVAPFDPRMYDPERVGHPPFLDRALRFLAEDVVFVLDRLTALSRAPDGILAERLDLERVGIFGVSLGGAIGVEACHLDPRIGACLAMDVFVPADVLRSGLRQPLMLMTRDARTMQHEGWAQADIDETQTTVRAAFADPSSDRYLALVPGMFHGDFADLPFMTPIASRLGLSGSIAARRAHRIVTAYMLAFFDRYLKGRATTLLDGPSAEFPEVFIETRRP